jgi:hypothetical protein
VVREGDNQLTSSRCVYFRRIGRKIYAEIRREYSVTLEYKRNVDRFKSKGNAGGTNQGKMRMFDDTNTYLQRLEIRNSIAGSSDLEHRFHLGLHQNRIRVDGCAGRDGPKKNAMTSHITESVLADTKKCG